jgi:pSer/pThr/pTyr-binding forkhead associated (FHA) protein
MANMPGNTPSAAPVGFKSKVVSRRHCEFWYENGKWYIKDVKSSSGTFLNHIRLSPPSQESKAFPVNDGDIVQLGIDFKGGEEMIFRCVKMRLELNRGWQNKLNTFNVAAHKRLRTMGTDSQSTSGSSDCSICLNSIAPCQSLFVAPCSHTWHYKCVRSLLNSPQYPIFVCPNCRAGADLEADVEDPAENWDQTDAPEPSGDDVSVHAPNGHDGLSNGDSSAAGQDMTIMPAETPDVNDGPEVDPMELTVNIPPPAETPETRGNLPHAVSEPLPIRNVAPGAGRVSNNAAGTPPGPTAEGPITPRNDAGPWVFDGRAGQAEAQSPSNGMRSLDAAADDLHNGVQTSSDSSSR